MHNKSKISMRKDLSSMRKDLSLKFGINGKDTYEYMREGVRS